MAGELSLTGDLKPVPGVLPLAARARREGAKGLFVPAANAAEAAVVEGLAVYAVDSLGQALRFFSGEKSLAPIVPAPFAPSGAGAAFTEDFAEVKGQEHAVADALHIGVALGLEPLAQTLVGDGHVLRTYK